MPNPQIPTKVWNNLRLWSNKDSTQFSGQLMKLNSINDVLMKNNYHLNRTGDWHWCWNEVIDETLTLCFSFYWFLLLSCCLDPVVTSFNQKSPGEQKKPTTCIHKQPTERILSDNWFQKTPQMFSSSKAQTRANQTHICTSARLEKNGFCSCLVPWRSRGLKTIWVWAP